MVTKRLSVIVVLLVLLPGMAAAQSLAEAARNERERRKKNQEQGVKVRVITEEEVSTSEPEERPSEEGVPRGVESRSERSANDEDEGLAAAEPGRDRQLQEQSWRYGVAEARSRVAKAQKRVDFLKELSLVPGEYYVDENNRPVITSLAQLRQMMAEAEAELAAAQKGLDELLERARRAGVPPGWLR